MKPNEIGIVPDKTYHINEAATLLRKTPEWIKANWIRTDQIVYTREGNDTYFLGQWIIDCIVSRASRRCEDFSKQKK